MMPRKKLEYYAKKHGLEHTASVRLTDEECERICKAVGTSKVYGVSDTGGRLWTLIDCVMDDEAFRGRHGSSGAHPDFLLSRYPDYAADEVMVEYSRINSADRSQL